MAAAPRAGDRAWRQLPGRLGAAASGAGSGPAAPGHAAGRDSESDRPSRTVAHDPTRMILGGVRVILGPAGGGGDAVNLNVAEARSHSRVRAGRGAGCARARAARSVKLPGAVTGRVHVPYLKPD